MISLLGKAKQRGPALILKNLCVGCKPVARRLLACAAALLLCRGSAFPGANSASAQNPSERDGQRDFDFELGSWKIHLKRLVHPLTGSTTWVAFDGMSVARKAWDGRAQIEEFEVGGPNGKIEGLTLRLYNPQAHQWSLYWANSKEGIIGGPPNVGEFKNGRGEFFCQDTFNGRAILVRYVWSDITPNSAHFEQSYSTDGGRTWEANWITDQVRVKE
jgi:hypothetical protein